MKSGRKIYDAIVVGSGATGGWAAKELTERGLEVLVLEAGRKLGCEDLPRASRRGGAGSRAGWNRGRQSIQSECWACDEHSNHLFVDDEENPYLTPDGKPFYWIRGRQVGGRTVVWSGQCYRMSDYELKAAGRDGYGEDWPLAYADLAPYYDRVEKFLGVVGTREGLPQLPDGQFLAPREMGALARRFKSAVERRCEPARAIPGRYVRTAPRRRGAACRFCGLAGDGCAPFPYASSQGSTLHVARLTGRMTLRPNSVASRVLIDRRTGKASGVAFVDRLTRDDHEAHARVVVLCTSTIESARLLLNSATRQHPAGLGNGGGALGRYLMDHTYGIYMEGLLPAGGAGEATRGGRGQGLYIPRFRNVARRHAGFLRGYGVQVLISPPRRPGDPARVQMSAFGEMLPRPENRVTVSRGRADAWGIPVAQVECAHSDNERQMARDQAATLREMAHAAGVELTLENDELSPPGLCIHEVGAARMGADPRTSVVNGFGQCHEVKNLFVTDGACFTTSGVQNPTLTMMALTARACDYLAEQYRRGGL